VIRSLLLDRRGSVVTVFAFSTMVFAVLTAIVMNQISFYLAKRKLQSAVDMAALMIMESGRLTKENAKALIEKQLGEEVTEVSVMQGNYSPDIGVAPESRFTANATPFNAVQVSAQIAATKVMLGEMLPDDLRIYATARAARRTTVSVMMGSRLVRVEGGLSAALLDATLGYKGKLTVMDYNALASAQVDVGEFLRALNTEANIQAVTFDDVLSAPVSVKDVLDAMIATTADGSVQVLLKKASPASGGDAVVMNDVLDLGSMTRLPIDSLLAGESAPVSVGEVLAGSVALADGDHQVSLDLASVLGDNSIANVGLDIGEKPQVMSYQSRAPKGNELNTSQFGLSVGALGNNPLTAVKLDVTMANATVKIHDINCHADGTADVTLKAQTEAASVGLKAPLLPKISAKLGNNEQKTLKFSQADIDAQTYKPVRSGLGLQLNSLSVAQKLLFNPVDALLEKLGLHVAEADVKVVEATCGAAGLVY
jgi:uncharacterized membrane protein